MPDRSSEAKRPSHRKRARDPERGLACTIRLGALSILTEANVREVGELILFLVERYREAPRVEGTT